MAAGALALAVAAAGEVQAQAIERNLPPEIQHGSSTILTPNVLPTDKDTTPLGGKLNAIVALSAEEAVRTGAPSALDLSHGGRVDTPQARRRLQRFLGRPLSRKLIAEVEAEIALYYRAKGFPLVSVSTPEQEISTGVLQVRVIEFHLEKKTAPGAKDPGYVLSRIRAEPGHTVDANKLSQDLDWLNRYPFRRSDAAFSPGEALGATDLILQTTATKPWSIYAGYSDSGSPLTGFDRYDVGISLALPFLHDAYGSYQFTGSQDVLSYQDRPLNSAPNPTYLSHSGRIVIPTLPRQDIEATLNFVQTNQVGDFTSHQTTEEASLAYRSALSNILGVLPGEAMVGVEAQREFGTVKFLPSEEEPDQSGAIDVFQVNVGYSVQATDRFGRSSLDLTVHISPGGITDRNTDAAFAASSQKRSTSAEYAYVSGDFSRYTTLPFGFAYSASVIGQYAFNPVPLTDQIGLGGPSLVRGYTQDDGVFDSAILARNELRTPVTQVLGRFDKAWADQLSPYAFIDAGYGKNEFASKNFLKHADESPVGAGIGTDYQFGQHLSASLSGGWALKHEGLTHSGRARLESRVVMTF